jgi:diacylglycerol kinase family enzyme
MGTYSRIANLDTPEDKKLLGRFAYLRLLFREVRAGRTWAFRMWQDGAYSRRRASLVLAANVGATGLPGLQWREDAAPDDGVIDLCIVRAKTAGEYLTLLWDALRGRHEAGGAMEYAEIRDSLTIKTSNGLPLRGDGKEIGKGSVEIKVLRGALQVMAPAASSC